MTHTVGMLRSSDAQWERIRRHYPEKLIAADPPARKPYQVCFWRRARSLLANSIQSNYRHNISEFVNA
jgi:hypothetical protein